MTIMKARVKATGDIIEIDEDCSYVYAKNYDKSYTLNKLEFLDVKENETHDYWDKLLHQYAGMAMQGILANPYLMKEINDFLAPELHIAKIANEYATALVERMKQKED